MTAPARRTWAGWARRAPRVALLVAALLSASGQRAAAHVTLVSSVPARGSHLVASPPLVRLLFAEEVDAGLARLTLVAAGGLETRLTATRDPRDVRALTAPLPALAPGAYRVRWHVVSDDGHPVEGNVTFWVDAPPQAATTAASPPPPPPEAMPDEEAPRWLAAIGGAPVVPALLRGFALGCLMALAGLLFFSVRHEPAADATTLRVARALALAAPVLLVAHAAAWAVMSAPEHDLSREVWEAETGTTMLRMEALRCAAALLCAWALWLARRRGLALGFAVVALLVSGAMGHAATSPLVATPMKAVHLVAGGAWIGGLLWMLTRPRDDARRLAHDAGQVSAAALVSVVLVAASGLVQAILFIPSVHAVTHTAYGVVTLLKVAGLLVLVAYGAHHRFRVMPRLADDAGHAGGFARTLRQELVVLGVVTLLGGLLSYTPTTVPHRGAPPTSVQP